MVMVMTAGVVLIPMTRVVSRLSAGELSADGINGIPKLNLKTIRAGTSGCGRSEQDGAINKRDIVLIEPQNRFQIVLSNLIKMKLDIVSPQLR